ncbi:hypothetical protein KT99_03624 [Shewanella benthica KT99]|uniref:Uncharacterized protein n=2 Tax=Shewanella benthica TaxID=43661 RepID=A9DAI8_9GAMM|nr:hypothetical protein KT99_20893 [Shewanella benthica KT99]EDQ00604.1 hypothetical protein KT99_03624 [Shewanella benthica KT99]
MHTQGATRGRSIDYHHVIHALAKKRNAFKASQIRDALIPKGGEGAVGTRAISRSIM